MYPVQTSHSRLNFQMKQVLRWTVFWFALVCWQITLFAVNKMQRDSTHSRPQCLRVWECARKLWETLRRSSQSLAILASQRMLFDPTKTFCFFYIYFIAKVLCCFGIRTEGIQLTVLKSFQVSKALLVAAEKIALNVPNHRFDTWSLHMLDSWLNISVDHFTRR